MYLSNGKKRKTQSQLMTRLYLSQQSFNLIWKIIFKPTVVQLDMEVDLLVFMFLKYLSNLKWLNLVILNLMVK